MAEDPDPWCNDAPPPPEVILVQADTEELEDE
jgi:hypothetical protein